MNFIRRLAASFGTLFNSHSQALIKRLLTDQGAKHWKGYASAFVMMVLIAATTSLSAWIMGSIVNKIFIQKRLESVWLIGGAILVIYVIKGLATYGQQVTLARIANNIVADIQKRIFDQMLTMKLALYNASHSTEFIARQSFIGQSASNVLNLLITALARDLMTIIGLAAVMASQDAPLALFTLIIVPVAVVGVRGIGFRIRRVMETEFQGFAAIMESLQETAQGIRVVKAFNLEPHMRSRQAAAIDSLESASNKLVAVSSRTSPLMESLGGIAVAGVVIYGGLRVIVNGQQPGSFFAFITSLLLIYEPIKRIARLHVDLTSSLFGVGMLYDFLDRDPGERELPSEPKLKVSGGKIEFKNVTFGYHPAQPVLNCISFVAEPGKTTALVGRSGGGKSTIMSLILRYYELDSGEIYIDDQNIAQMSRSSVRQNIGYVSQENFLFKGSVRENIALGRPGASGEEIIAAGKAAFAHDFIMSFDAGYDTPCGEHGMQLSGGQRQRIAIARAFLKDAPVILLDEATSALDSESERAIQEALKRLCEGRTTLVIAHRLSTVVNADVIYMIDKGELIERGSHMELMEKGGQYYHIAASQFPKEAI